jgi:hypothetical protein
MTPQEKAIELVDKMYATQGPEDGITYYEAIDCALIAVDLILTALDIHQWQNRQEIDYWNEVKQEIEKL